MKRQRKDSRIALIIAIISAIILLISIILICTNMVDNNIIEIVVAILLFLSAVNLMVFIVATVTFYFFERHLQKTKEKSFQKIKSKLSNEFSEVKLRDPEEATFMEGIPNKEIKVMAKLDENDKIIFTVQVDTQVETDSYEWFTSHFDV